jgi:hypothetical protein
MITLNTKQVTITASEALSTAVELGGGRLVGIIMPAVWTAASITLQGSVDGSTYYDVFDKAGARVTLVAVATNYVTFTIENGYFLPFIKLRSCAVGDATTDVNQAATRVLTLIIN